MNDSRGAQLHISAQQHPYCFRSDKANTCKYTQAGIPLSSPSNRAAQWWLWSRTEVKLPLSPTSPLNAWKRLKHSWGFSSACSTRFRLSPSKCHVALPSLPRLALPIAPHIRQAHADHECPLPLPQPGPHFTCCPELLAAYSPPEQSPCPPQPPTTTKFAGLPSEKTALTWGL